MQLAALGAAGLLVATLIAGNPLSEFLPQWMAYIGLVITGIIFFVALFGCASSIHFKTMITKNNQAKTYEFDGDEVKGNSNCLNCCYLIYVFVIVVVFGASV